MNFPNMTTTRIRTWWMHSLLLLLALLIAGAATVSDAQEQRPRRQPAQQTEQHQGEARQEARPAESRESVLRLLPADSVTEHSIDLPGGKLAYTATAGTFSLFAQSGERSAAIFYTAYVAKNGEKNGDSANRPVTFVFNGGPGAASAYLHLGVVGPRIVEFPGNDASTARLQDNPNTWLAFTDLVLIDPVGAGWSRPAKPDGAKPFQGVRGDAESLAKTIPLSVANNNPRNPPNFIPPP